MTRERVENAVESRLRAARMLAADNFGGFGGVLGVRITVSGSGSGRSVQYATSVTVSFEKWLFDRISTLGGNMNRGFASSYTITSSLLHGSNDAGFVMEDVNYKLDEFINDYLRVNEPACAARAGRGR